MLGGRGLKNLMTKISVKTQSKCAKKDSNSMYLYSRSQKNAFPALKSTKMGRKKRQAAEGEEEGYCIQKKPF